MTIKTSKMYHRIICIIFSVQFSQSCHVKYKEYRHYSDPVFSKADHEEIYNWDESAVIFGHKKFPLIMNYKGQVCRPGRYRFTIEDYGPGVGAAVSNHGILVCGGSNNVWKGPKNPTFGGKVNFEFEKWISLNFAPKFTNTFLTVKSIFLLSAVFGATKNMVAKSFRNGPNMRTS